ncbi:hypothetical protein HDU96_003496 [Phlyctochytrium bullatum]|nr:hypothetical protein HDU96_003496 [Phlyctochytrium bullatum]
MKSTKVAIPWLLKYYPLIALAASLVISIPLAFYKWKFAIESEYTEGRRAFQEVAVTARDVCKQTLHLQLMKCSYVDIDDLPWQQLANFTSTRDGGFRADNVSFGLYKNISFDQRDMWEQKLLRAERLTGVPRRDVISKQLFPVVLISNLDEAPPTVFLSMGFNAYSDPKDRRAFIEYVAATGLPKTSGRLQLTSSIEPTAGVLMVVPLFKSEGGEKPTVTSLKTASLDSVAWAGIEVQRLLTGSWSIQVVAKSGYLNNFRTSFPLRLLFIALIDPMVAVVFHICIMIIERVFHLIN